MLSTEVPVTTVVVSPQLSSCDGRKAHRKDGDHRSTCKDIHSSTHLHLWSAQSEKVTLFCRFLDSGSKPPGPNPWQPWRRTGNLQKNVSYHQRSDSCSFWKGGRSNPVISSGVLCIQQRFPWSLDADWFISTDATVATLGAELVPPLS